MGGLVSERYRLVLKCRFCDLVPGPEAQVAMLAEHFKAEHAAVVEFDEEGNPKMHLDMVPIHLPCEAVAAQVRPVKASPYKCPKCGTIFFVK